MKQIHSLLVRKNGTTMVSVIVAFGVLLLMVALFSQVVRMAGQMYLHAESNKDETDALTAAYYLGEGTEEDVTGTGDLQLRYQSEIIPLHMKVVKYGTEDSVQSYYSFHQE